MVGRGTEGVGQTVAFLSVQAEHQPRFGVSHYDCMACAASLKSPLASAPTFSSTSQSFRELLHPGRREAIDLRGRSFVVPVHILSSGVIKREA